MLDDDWVVTGPHQFIDCWCGHSEASALDGRTLNVEFDRVHRWITLGCDEDCAMQSRMHGHVHIHCPECAERRAGTTCCTPSGLA